MPIRDGQLRFGYDGDGGLGERLIAEVLAGTKTATCMPVGEYDPELLSETRSSVGTRVQLVDGTGTVRCLLNVTRVYETPSYDLDPGMLAGEGYGTDAAAFLAEHVESRSPALASVDRLPEATRVLAPLPLRMAAVAWLHDAGGFSLSEIGEALGLADHQTRAELRRARVRLAHPPPDAAPSCRTARPGFAREASESERQLATVHIRGCERCRSLADRLEAVAAGARPDDYESVVEEAEIARITGQPAILNTLFLVTEFELA